MGWRRRVQHELKTALRDAGAELPAALDFAVSHDDEVPTNAQRARLAAATNLRDLVAVLREEGEGEA